MRKRLNLWMLFMLALFLVAVPCQAAGNNSGNVELHTYAAKKNGLVKEKGKYRYYENGKLVKKAWKTIKKKKYYFQSNGNAAVGSVKIKGKYYIFNEKGQLFTPSANKIVKVNKIKYQVNKKGQAVKGWSKDKNYYFYDNGRMVTGTEVFKEKFYCFKSNGKYDKTMTSKMRKAAKYEEPFSKLLALIGEPKKRKYSQGCYGNGTDCLLTYDNFVVYTSFDTNGVELFMGAE